jgi:hypothetical protein
MRRWMAASTLSPSLRRKAPWLHNVAPGQVASSQPLPVGAGIQARSGALEGSRRAHSAAAFQTWFARGPGGRCRPVTQLCWAPAAAQPTAYKRV